MIEEKKLNYCSLPTVPEREFRVDINPHRRELIMDRDKLWVNGTILHYYFFDKERDGEYVTLSDGRREWRTWTTSEETKNVVRDAFKKWKSLGIGLEFREVATREEAEVRIGFMQDNRSWSYVGRDIINIGLGKDDRTMNLGWNIIKDPDTALHEIGHTLGLQHEHQNPKAGIQWDEEAVYNYFAGPPNNWSREMTYHNVLKKLYNVKGSNWDPNSIMEYSFQGGLIIKPEEYQGGLEPESGLSEFDIKWIKIFYPPMDRDDLEELSLLESKIIMLDNGEQKDFIIKPNETKKYNIATFGKSDSVIVLYEKNNDDEVYISGDDDSGEEYNASMNIKLHRGKKYILRVRLYYRQKAGEVAVMYW